MPETSDREISDSEIIHESEGKRHSLRVYDNGEGFIDYKGKGREKPVRGQFKVIGIEELAERGIGWLCVGKEKSREQLSKDLKDEIFISSQVVKTEGVDLVERLGDGGIEMSSGGVNFEMGYSEVKKQGKLHFSFKLKGMYGGKSQSNMIMSVLEEMYWDRVRWKGKEEGVDFVLGGLIGGWVRLIGDTLIGGVEIGMEEGLV